MLNFFFPLQIPNDNARARLSLEIFFFVTRSFSLPALDRFSGAAIVSPNFMPCHAFIWEYLEIIRKVNIFIIFKKKFKS